MPVDECGKFDAVMAARESAAERGWRGDRDVALLAEPAAWLRGNRSRYNFGPDGLNGSSGPKADLNCPCDLSRQPMSSDSKARTNFSKGRSASRTRPSKRCWNAIGKPTTSSPDCRKCSRRCSDAPRSRAYDRISAVTGANYRPAAGSSARSIDKCFQLLVVWELLGNANLVRGAAHYER